MGDSKRRLDIVNERLVALELVYEAIHTIQRWQVILINILVKKMEVTDNEIEQETKRLDAIIKEHQRDLKSGKI